MEQAFIMVEDAFRGDDAVIYTVTGTTSDNFTSSWVNIHDFNDRNTLDLVNIRDIDTMHLVVESLDASTGASLSLSSTGSDNFTRRSFANRSDDNISAVLQALHINAPSASNQVDIRLPFGGDAWSGLVICGFRLIESDENYGLNWCLKIGTASRFADPKLNFRMTAPWESRRL